MISVQNGEDIFTEGCSLSGFQMSTDHLLSYIVLIELLFLSYTMTYLYLEALIFNHASVTHSMSLFCSWPFAGV